MKPTLIKSLALATVLLAQLAAARAGELTLFARDHFRGQEVTVREGAHNLRDLGFNDRASSMVVRSGVWEVCEHKDFSGTCVVFERGEYPNLSRFNNSVSSVREIERRGRGHGYGRDRDGDGRPDRDRDHDGRPDRDRDHDGRPDRDRDQDGRPDRDRDHDGRPDRDGRDGQPGWNRPDPLELFSGPRFEGRRVTVQGEMRNLRALDFNDRAGSLVILEGQWQVCEHDDFRGQCVVYGPGRHEGLSGMHNRISSLRRVR